MGLTKIINPEIIHKSSNQKIPGLVSYTPLYQTRDFGDKIDPKLGSVFYSEKNIRFLIN